MQADARAADPASLRRLLARYAVAGTTGTYQEIARELGLQPPHTIHRLALGLEALMDADAAAGRPLLSSVVVSRAGSGLPAAGFFEHAAALGRFAPGRDDAAGFHARELAAVQAWYRQHGE